MSKGVQIAIGAGVVVLLLGWYGSGQLREASFVYYQTLGEFRASGTTGESARVHGYVTEGSIERDVSAQTVRFMVQETPPHAGGPSSDAMRVVYTSLEVPDLFKDGAEVVVEGKLQMDRSFEASNLLAKCPSKFEGMDPAVDGMSPAAAGMNPPAAGMNPPAAGKRASL